ncbi:MAG: tagaturonate epimerase family protein [Anaerolineae bacterium]|nr:tagaturonate epimerase family protein [Anaerolineae bacterium]
MSAKFEIVTDSQGRSLKVTGDLLAGMHGERQGDAWICPLDSQNAAAVRKAMPWTAPIPVGLRKSIGCGDRLGLATPGHILAVQDSDMFPVLPQQSIREMERSKRSPQNVMDDATWGVLQMNYQSGFGSDADHLKNTGAIDDCIAAGFVGFTLDPNEYVDNAAHTDAPATLQQKFDSLPWNELETSAADLKKLYLGTTPGGTIDDEALLRATGKYSRAIAHVMRLARHIDSKFDGQPYDLEVSVDETDTPTSPAEHYFIAAELKRLGVNYQGLAPRFIGRFEKGVDYIGPLDVFEQDFAAHARIARELGPYKLSIHTGSDKFSIYPIIYQYTGQYVHLKTAGTSWLEALRVIAMNDVPLFREILDFAIERYPIDRASYHVSAELAKVPTHPADSELLGLFDQFDARQVLHVTFGSVLDQYREQLYAVLYAHLSDYDAVLKKHFDRHIAPFQSN